MSLPLSIQTADQAVQLVPAEFMCCATALFCGSWWRRPCGREGPWDDTSTSQRWRTRRAPCCQRSSSRLPFCLGRAVREGLLNHGTPPIACADDLTHWEDQVTSSGAYTSPAEEQTLALLEWASIFWSERLPLACSWNSDSLFQDLHIEPC